MKDKLPTVTECITYVESLGYRLRYKEFYRYCFKDITGKRPPHNQEMTWTLREMRDAVTFGC